MAPDSNRSDDQSVAETSNPTDIDFENIPQYQRERAHWLYWNASADKPRKPLASPYADYGASWTDPDEWTDFETAREQYEADDSGNVGLGFVFAQTIDDAEDGDAGAIDIDGCLNWTDDGYVEPKDWLPSLKPFLEREAFMDISPSDGGLHIPVRDIDIPEWWSNEHFTDDEHEGVEVYDKKFFTVTGRTEPLEARNVPVGDDPVEGGGWLDEWLREAYKAITGDDPLNQHQTTLSGDDSAYDGDASLDPDDVREALEHIDPDVDYSTWRDIGFALDDEFPSATAKSLFKEWSRSGTKWDDNAERQAERIIDDASPGGGRTLSTIVYYAKQGGWEPPATGTQRTPSQPSPSVPDADSQLSLDPSSVRIVTNVGENGSISDLTDREKAAAVWGLIREHNTVHVRVRRDNATLWAYNRGVWTPDGERALRHAAREALGPMNYGANVLAELKEQARADPTAEVDPDEMGLSPGTIAVKNGLMCLDDAAESAVDDARRELRPEDYALTRLPVDYDASASYDKWATHVEEWVEDGRARALQEYVGYCLHVGAMPIHRTLLLVGTGANGKGTFLTVVRALLGDENTTSIELQTLANERDAVADFYESLANIDDDLSSRQLGAGLGMFKKLSGGDRVRARHLYEDGFEFDATGKHLYAANEVPDVDIPDDDEAFWRRWLLVEFPNHYPPSERDPSLSDELTTDDALSGVLNWAIDGWKRLLEQRYFTNEDHYAHEKRQRWQAWGESVDKFISECVECDSEADRITTHDAHRRYAAWCRENDEDPVGQRQFTTTLKNEDVGYKTSTRIGENVCRGYEALGFTDDVPALSETPDRSGPPEVNHEQESLV